MLCRHDDDQLRGRAEHDAARAGRGRGRERPGAQRRCRTRGRRTAGVRRSVGRGSRSTRRDHGERDAVRLLVRRNDCCSGR